MENSTQRVALIAGATGLVGHNCVQFLLNNDHYAKVIALSRRPLDLTHEKLDNRVIDFDNMSRALDNETCDDVFCCLGTTIKQAGSKENFRKVDFDYCLELAKLGKRSGAQHFLLISAVGANAKSHFFYNKVKGELEQAIESLGYDRFTVFQPSFLAGEREKMRRAESIAVDLTLKLSTLLIGPFVDYSVIKADNLAAAMVSRALSASDTKKPWAQRLRYRKIMQSLG